MKHKVLQDFQYLTSDKKIIVLKANTILENYIVKIGKDSIKIDKDIIENNISFFKPVDWREELTTYLKSNKIPQPAILSKKLTPFIEDMFFNIEVSSNNVDDLDKLKKLEDKEKQITFELESLNKKEENLSVKEKQLIEKDLRLQSKENELTSKIDELKRLTLDLNEKEVEIDNIKTKLQRKEIEVSENETNLIKVKNEIEILKNEIDSKESNLDSKHKELILIEADLNTKKVQLKKTESNLNLLKSKLEGKESQLKQVLEDYIYKDDIKQIIVDKINSLKKSGYKDGSINGVAYTIEDFIRSLNI